MNSTPSFAKDVSTYPYVAKKADRWVGVLGGTGCSRHWDLLDTHDASVAKPYDTCGRFVMVSGEFHKWVDLREFGPKTWWWSVRPVRGDVVLERATCDEHLPKPLYVLKQYAECGAPAVTLAYCDESGTELGAAASKLCK